MTKPARNLEWLVWGGLALLIAVIGGAYVRSQLRAPTVSLPVLGRIPEFNLTNQSGQAVSLASLRGQVWIADIIFTRCPGPCKTMSGQFAQLQAQLPAGQPVRLVSLTSDPTNDSPVVLKEYAGRFKADSDRWWFLTGNNAEIRSLAVNDFKFVVVDKKPEDRAIPDDLFLHSTWFALVDQKGQLRGWTDRQGSVHATFESDDPAALARLLPAVRQLLREPPL